jgi:hypothetical protein
MVDVWGSTIGGGGVGIGVAVILLSFLLEQEAVFSTYTLVA